jgi:bifunctional non-homologous end joining protein LigD
MYLYCPNRMLLSAATYRALAIKSNGNVLLRSRNNKDFNSKYPAIVRSLAALPDETVIDAEVVALD